MFDYVISGAGILGLSIAEALLKNGYKVLLLERDTCGSESSWAGGGILSPLCPWDYAEAVTRLTQYSAAKYAAWTRALHQATGIDPEYEISGMLVLPPFDLASSQRWCATHNMLLQQRQDGLFLPEVAQVRNPRLVQALRKHVEILGGRIIEHCEVLSIEVINSQVQKLVTAQGDFSADRYIVTAGAWSKQLLGDYALQLEIRPIRGQMLLFKFGAPPLRHILLQDGMYLIPRRDGHLLVGSTLEDVGFDKSTTMEARSSLWRRAQRLLPALREMQPVRQWSGLRPASPDNIPTIGRHPQLENLYLNSGHFRYGVTMAPGSAEILCNELHELAQPIDVSAYAYIKKN